MSVSVSVTLFILSSQTRRSDGFLIEKGAELPFPLQQKPAALVSKGILSDGAGLRADKIVFKNFSPSGPVKFK